MDAFLDIDGTIIPGKSTLIIAGHDIPKLKFILSIINSELAFFYLRNRYPASSYNQGTTFTKDMINALPLPRTTEKERRPFQDVVDHILALTASADYLENNDKQSNVKLAERQIDEMVYELYGLTREEAEAVQRKPRGLSQKSHFTERIGE